MSTLDPSAADAIPPHGLALVLPGRGNSPGEGFRWIGAGWRLFARAPLMWILSLVALFVVAIAMSFVPILGSLAFQVLQPVITAGFVVACRSLETGGEFEIEHLLAGFRERFVPLLILGAIFMLASLAILLVFAFFVGFSLLGAIIAGSYDQVLSGAVAGSMTLLLGALVAAALMVPLMAAYWFAPALVIMHGMEPLAAMKASFFATFRNFVPFLLYGLAMFVLAIVAMIPFGLGFLVWVPLMITSTYAAYRDIFTDDTRAEAGVTLA